MLPLLLFIQVIDGGNAVAGFDFQDDFLCPGQELLVLGMFLQIFGKALLERNLLPPGWRGSWSHLYGLNYDGLVTTHFFRLAKRQLKELQGTVLPSPDFCAHDNYSLFARKTIIACLKRTFNFPSSISASMAHL